MLSLIQAVCGRPWMYQYEIALEIRKMLAKDGIAALRHLAEVKREVHAFDDEGDRPRAAQMGATRASSNVAIIPIFGTLTQHGDTVNSADTRSTDAIAREAHASRTEASIDSVLLHIDSPGGEVFGGFEAWQAVRELAKVKPVVAIANSTEASLALLLGGAATEKWVTIGGGIGSLGVFSMHVDESKALEAEGVAVEFIVADDSPFKTEGASAGALTDDARAHRKATVNRYMDMFVKAQARDRGVSVEHVREHFGKGRMLSPEEAVAAKMADRVGTLNDAIRRAAQLGREARKNNGVGGVAAWSGI